jgi:hypothetical protein
MLRPLDVPLLSRFASRAGFVSSRQTLVRRRQKLDERRDRLPLGPYLPVTGVHVSRAPPSRPRACQWS